MTADEKLEKCVEFIRRLEKFNKTDYDIFKLDDTLPCSVYCEECGCDIKVEPNWPTDVSGNTEYIDYKVIDDISDKAWHLLADIDRI